MKFLSFIRQYGPVSRNDNMYDETIQRSAKRSGVEPICFEHPAQMEVLSCFDPQKIANPFSVILTGTAGDGKTHLCRNIWAMLGGAHDLWASDDPYISMTVRYPKGRDILPNTTFTETPELYKEINFHVIRDLSGWAPQQGLAWPQDKAILLQKFCCSIFDFQSNDVFLVAANDGQLIESWRRLPDTPEVIRTRQIIEDLLVEDRQQESGVLLRMFNLSRWNSADIFDLAYSAFINHPEWQFCYGHAKEPDVAFSASCPIRHNYEILKTPLVEKRIRALIELCDHNGLHLPIRQILLLLSNSVLGHPDCKDHLMRAADVPEVIKNGSLSKASIYNNILGGNLSESRREAITVFDYFDRFQIGYETCNRIDNILIFGDGDEQLNCHFQRFVASDTFYGADKWYYDTRSRYIEGMEEDTDASSDFLKLLLAQRRGLFFKIPVELEEELRLWDLTVFRFAGEYLRDVSGVMQSGGTVRRPILSRLVKGLNRIFTGMLINSERELCLATSGSYSQAKISKILVDRVSVDPKHGERITLNIKGKHRVQLIVSLAVDISESLDLNLIRYEFLSRVATEGALPASFSKECYEDMLAFKSRLLSAYKKRYQKDCFRLDNNQVELKMIDLSSKGLLEDIFVEIKL